MNMIGSTNFFKAKGLRRTFCYTQATSVALIKGYFRPVFIIQLNILELTPALTDTAAGTGLDIHFYGEP